MILFCTKTKQKRQIIRNKIINLNDKQLLYTDKINDKVLNKELIDYINKIMKIRRDLDSVFQLHEVNHLKKFLKSSFITISKLFKIKKAHRMMSLSYNIFLLNIKLDSLC
jgi:hypothetical protein